MPTLSFHSLQLLLIAYQARNRAILDAQRPNALTTDSILAVVMAAASTEAFINEFAEHITLIGGAAWSLSKIDPSVVACADVLVELEESKAQVTVKYLLASLALSGKSFSKSAAPYQDFALLIQLRNAIMHVKPVSGDKPHQGEKIGEILGKRKIAFHDLEDSRMHWFDRLQVPAVAIWACEAAHAMMLATLDLLPSAAGDGLTLNRSFREHVGLSSPQHAPPPARAAVIAASTFAARKHRDQRRKDAVSTPYINHPLALADVLANEARVADTVVLVAALLHDTIEDTSTTPEELIERFGPDVAAIVLEVTDDKSLPKAERKRLQIEHAATISDRAKLVKLADKICNLRDMTVSPPADWSAERKQEYFDWAKQVIDRLRGVNAKLEGLFDLEYAKRPR